MKHCYFLLFFFINSLAHAYLFYPDSYSEENIEKHLLAPAQRLEYAAITPSGVLWKQDELLTSVIGLKNTYDPTKDTVEFYNPVTEQRETIGIIGSLIHPLSGTYNKEGTNIARLKLQKPVTVVDPIPLNRSASNGDLKNEIVQFISYGDLCINRKNLGSIVARNGRLIPHFGQAFLFTYQQNANYITISLSQPETLKDFCRAIPHDNDKMSVMLKEIKEEDGIKLRIVGIKLDNNMEDSYTSIYDLLNLKEAKSFFTQEFHPQENDEKSQNLLIKDDEKGRAISSIIRPEYNLQNSPEELLFYILSSLEPKDLGRVRLVSRLFYNIGKDNALWFKWLSYRQVLQAERASPVSYCDVYKKSEPRINTQNHAPSKYSREEPSIYASQSKDLFRELELSHEKGEELIAACLKDAVSDDRLSTVIEKAHKNIDKFNGDVVKAVKGAHFGVQCGLKDIEPALIYLKDIKEQLKALEGSRRLQEKPALTSAQRKSAKDWIREHVIYKIKRTLVHK